MKKLIIVVVVLGILALGAYGGRKVYRQWKVHNAVAQAKEAFEKQEYSEGLLWLRKALNANASNIDAIQMMADFTEMAQVPTVVFWRQRLVDLQPYSMTNQLLLARSALVHKEYDTAKMALDKIQADDRTEADFLKISGAFAVATGQYGQAETNFTEAIKLQPNNAVAKLNLGMIRVQRTDPALAEEGRDLLKSLLTNDLVRTDALRHLTMDAMRHTNNPRAISYSAELVETPKSGFNDKLLRLDTLVRANDPEFKPVLESYQMSMRTNASEAFALSRWMLGSAGPVETFNYLQTLPPTLQTNLPVTMVVADAFMAMTNWTGLQKHVETQNWADFEYLRLCFTARASRKLELLTASKAEWAKALLASEGRLDRLQALQRVLVNWNWVPELEDVLWMVVNRYPDEKSAVQGLSNLLYVQGKTRSLLTLYAQEFRLSPDNLAIKNNLASVALLLDAVEHQPHKLAREVYEAQKENPIYVATYAYSLHLQGKTDEALQLMSQLKPEYLENETLAGYYGLVLAESGDKEQAKKYMEIAAKARLLPEEKELFSAVEL